MNYMKLTEDMIIWDKDKPYPDHLMNQYRLFLSQRQGVAIRGILEGLVNDCIREFFEQRKERAEQLKALYLYGIERYEIGSENKLYYPSLNIPQWAVDLKMVDTQEFAMFVLDMLDVVTIAVASRLWRNKWIRSFRDL